MTLEEYYDGLGDIAVMRANFSNDETIIKFLRMLPDDENYENLKKAVADGDVEKAFRSAHTIKGVAQNLGLTEVYRIDFGITEALRAGNMEEAKKNLPELCRLYDVALERIGEL